MKEPCRSFIALWCSDEGELLQALQTVEKKIGTYDYFSPPARHTDNQTHLRYVSPEKTYLRGKLLKQWPKWYKKLHNENHYTLRFLIGYVTASQVVTVSFEKDDYSLPYDKGYQRLEMVIQGNTLTAFQHSHEICIEKVGHIFLNDLRRLLLRSNRH